MKVDATKQKLEEQITFFKDLAVQYPLGTYGDTAAKLEQQLVDHVSKIGKKHK